MPPIDPRLIAGPPPMPPQGQGLAGMPAPIVPNGTVINPTNVVSNQHTQTEDQRARAMMPSQVSEGQSNAEIARLKLEEMRRQQGLDPATGKPDVTKGLLGQDAIADLNPGEQNTVKAITQGRFPVTGFSMRNPETMKLVQRAMQYEPGTDLTTFQRRSVAFQKFMSNPNTPMLRVNQALQHLDRFHQSAMDLNNIHNESGFNPLALGNYPKAAAMAIMKDKRYAAFAADRDALAGELAAAFKGSNDTAHADKEAWVKTLSAANSPESFDSLIKETVGLLSGRVEASNAQFKQAVGANADFYDLMSPAARKVFEKYSAPEFGTPAQNAQTEASTKETGFTLPQGYQDEHAQFLANHPKGTLTPEDYRAFRQSMDKKYGQPGAPLSSDLQNLDQFVKDYNERGLSPATKVPTAGKTLTPEQHALAGLAEGPGGAAIANAGNAMAFGLPEALSGQNARDTFHDLSEKDSLNHYASLGGDILGSLAPMHGLQEGSAALVERLLPKLNPTARLKLLGDVGVNAGYGSIRGFNGAQDGHGAEGALEGAAGGAVAAGAGNLITKGVKPLISDATSKAIASLKGVKLTTLQRLGLGEGEEAFQGVPFARGARKRSIESFNIDDANKALEPIGVQVPKGMPAGRPLNEFIDTQASNKYNELKPHIVGAADGTFDNAITGLQASATTPEKKAMWSEVNDALKLFKDPVTGHYTGDGYQAASQRLRALHDSFATQAENQGSVAAQDMARVADNARKQMQLLVQRQTPEIGAQLKNVERVWANKMRIEDASNRATTTGGVYSPNQKLTSIKKFDTSTNKGRFARNKSLGQDYAQSAQDVLGGENVPSKASVRETAYTLGGGIGLGAISHGVVPAVLGGVGIAAYTPVVKRATQALLTGNRPLALDNEATRRALEDYFRHNMTGN